MTFTLQSWERIELRREGKGLPGRGDGIWFGGVCEGTGQTYEVLQSPQSEPYRKVGASLCVFTDISFKFQLGADLL